MQERFIETPDQLQDLCTRLAHSQWLALDTEFLREKTYYAKFCLLQVANDELAACIDPLRIDDLTPLKTLLERESITKVFHAGRQDLEILHRLWGRLPTPLFDTQLAAMITGLGDQVSYAALVHKMLGKELDKSHVRTDWSQRPLEPEQWRYALDDVIYLGRIYEQLRTKMAELGRSHWLDDNFEALGNPANYVVDPQQQWQRIRGRQQLKGVKLAVLRALAAWREERAMASDRPKNWIVKDEALLELARRMPKERAQLERIRGLEKRAADRHGNDLLRLIAKTRDLPSDQWPREAEERPRLTAGEEALTDLLMCVLRLQAEECCISPQSLATRKELELLVVGRRDLDLLSGWRRAVIGEPLLETLAGRRWPQWEDGRLVVRREKRSG